MIDNSRDHCGDFTEMAFDPVAAGERSGLYHLLEITRAAVVWGAHCSGFDHLLGVWASPFGCAQGRFCARLEFV